MANINLGLKIRELRKKKGITQEALASALSVSPQAVSKWESGLTYPDMSIIPIIAGYFEVSLDTLFDYDLKEFKSKIKKIIKDANVYFFSDIKRYIEIIKKALAEYPGNEELTYALLDGYEYDLRENGNRSRLDEMIEISQRIISESGNYVKVCSVKDVQAAAYLEKGEYEKAKTVLESLPAGITLQYDAASFRLSGKDKLNAAINARCDHLQSLYQACFQEGNAWLEMDEKKIPLNDTPFEDYLKMAENAYRKGLNVLTEFMIPDCSGQSAYLWDGMQTFHYSFHQCIAACRKRLGDIEGCRKEIDEAYRIVSTSWDDFDSDRDEYMKYFNRYLVDLDLAEYVK